MNASIERVSSAPAVPGFRRRLTLFDVLCIGVNATVGSGVFALPDDMHRAMGGYSPLAFLLCALLLMPVALCFAELSGRYVDTGGTYLYARHAFGDRVGFVIGWFCWANTFVSWAANATLFVELAGARSSLVGSVLASTIVLLLGVVNYFGVKLGARLVNLLVIGKVGAILCFLLVAVAAFDPSKLGGTLPRGALGVGQGIYLSLFPLQGFEVAPVAAGETQNPKRNVPLGTMGALLLSALLFVVVQTVLVGTYPNIGAESGQPLVDAAKYLGPTIGIVVVVGSLVSVGGFTAGSALGSPRYAQAIAAHGLMPRALAKINARWSTPHVAIAWTTIITAILAFFFDYRRLVGMSNITVVIQYFFTCISVPALRKKEGEARGFRVPGGAIIPVIGALGSLGLVAGADQPEFLFAGATLALGILVAFGTKQLEKKTQPETAPSAQDP
ncbi:MAG TPA: APC family permease [Polyangium sp.]|nr:APC family permease [Polyangium sp.]